MRLETLLPLGKVDLGLRTPDTPLDITTVAAAAQMLERIGYTGLVVEETKDDPFKRISRFGRIVPNVEFSIAAKTDAGRKILADMARKIQAEDADRAGWAIVG